MRERGEWTCRTYHRRSSPCCGGRPRRRWHGTSPPGTAVAGTAGTPLSGDVVEAVTELKAQPGGGIAINGSGTLTRSLLSAGLIDELHLLIHPVVVGTGKHLFEAGDAAVGLQLADQRTFGNGVTYHVYKPAAAVLDAS